MGDIVVGIHQPNFMPWLGYFYKIWQSDVFIFLDDVQIQKTGASYTNRVSINNSGKNQYMTMPIKKDSNALDINQVKYLDERWKKKLLGTLQGSYAKAPFFKENKEFIFDLINFQEDNIAEYNINFIEQISKKLQFNTEFVKSSDFHIATTSTQRLIDLIKKVDGNIYLSGSGGDNYQEHEMYEKANIVLTYNKMPKFEYPQIKTDKFIGGLSIVDAIFNIGFDELNKDLFCKK
jgi:hypothetical protein